MEMYGRTKTLKEIEEELDAMVPGIEGTEVFFSTL
jgi:hypothetical protein